MAKLTCTLNNKKYLSFYFPSFDSEDLSDIINVTKKYGGIFQGVKKMKHGGLFGRSSLIVCALIPEENVIKFNDSQIKSFIKQKQNG